MLRSRGKARSMSNLRAMKIEDENTDATDEDTKVVTKHRMSDWKGLIETEKVRLRRLVFLVVVLLCASLAFMQFGFLGIGTNGHYVSYVFGLLVPVTAGTILLGRSGGVLCGVVAAAMHSLHAVVQPLDLYEKYFVGPIGALLLYVLVALVLGWLFALSLKNDPSYPKRGAYLLISCFVGASVATMVFICTVIAGATLNILQDIMLGGEGALSSSVIGGLDIVVSANLQLLFDFILMAIVALGCDESVRHLRKTEGKRSLRTSFRARLIATVTLTFMVISGACFFVITMRNQADARKSMLNEIDFIISQIQSKGDEFNRMVETVDIDSLPDESADALLSSFEIDSLFDNYSAIADGTAIRFTQKDGEYYVANSNSAAFPKGASSRDLWGPLGKEMLERLMSTEGMEQVVYTESPTGTFSLMSEDKVAEEASAPHDGGAETTTDGAAADSQAPADDASSDATAGAGEHDEVVVHASEIGYLCCKPYYDDAIAFLQRSSRVYASRTETVAWIVGIAFAMLGVIYVLVWLLLGSLVVTPIDETNGSLARITAGDLEERVEVRTNTEFQSLSDGINATVGALKGWIGEAERRMKRDLSTANAIQQSALPSTFPPFPEIDRFDIYASMDPAKEVGGDFYDFFLIDDHTLGFLIADVSGKGIPGALFMMAAKSELENFMQTGMDLDQAVTGANERLCHGNDAGMFVTVWAATLNYETGELIYVNAGHNPPLLRHDGKWEWLTTKGGLFLGTFERAKYRTSSLTLVPGDELLLYTDGVNEAFSVTEEEYGNDRLEDFVNAHADEHPRKLVDDLRADVARWAEGAEQSDDITMVALEYGVAPEVSGSIVLPAEISTLGQAMGLIDEELNKRLCPPAVRNRIDVAFEELYVNVCHYAYDHAQEPGKVMVSYSYTTDPSQIVVEIRDWGVPFDPVTMEDPTLPASVQEAKIGGLGIMMAKRCVDELTYERSGDGANVVTFTKAW